MGNRCFVRHFLNRRLIGKFLALLSVTPSNTLVFTYAEALFALFLRNMISAAIITFKSPIPRFRVVALDPTDPCSHHNGKVKFRITWNELLFCKRRLQKTRLREKIAVNWQSEVAGRNDINGISTQG